jgi:phage shock protein PspC (stress-responsive transcriptional regulator)
MEAQTQGPTPPEAPPPRRLYRSRSDRVIGGVCGGLGRYFGIDPIIFRIAAVALIFAGGAGLLIYLAMLLLVPDEGGEPLAPGASDRSRALTVVAIVVGAAVLAPILIGVGLFAGAVVVPLALLALAALLTWWLVSGQPPGSTPREVLRGIGLGLAVLAVCCAIAVGGFWAAGLGGGEVVAALIIVAGVALVAGAFVGRVRWLILPALALACPVAFVAAAGIDLEGGVGEREYRPSSAADVRDRYELGAGELVIDLRDASLPPGDTPLAIDLGMGEARLIVPENVCVATRADVGMGEVQFFDRDSGGVDVEFDDEPSAAETTPRVVVDADLGLGALRVSHDDRRDRDHDRGFGRFGPDRDRDEGEPGNRACADEGQVG